MPPSASASGSRHRFTVTPYDRSSQPSQSAGPSSQVSAQTKSKKRKAIADPTFSQNEPTPTLAATAMAAFATGSGNAAGGRTGSGDSTLTDLSQASGHGSQGEGKKQRKKKRRAERASAARMSAEAGEGSGDVDMKTERVTEKEDDTTHSQPSLTPVPSAWIHSLPSLASQTSAPPSASPLDTKPPVPTAKTDFPSLKHKRKHGANEAGESRFVNKMRELRQAREDLTKTQARLAEEEKARKEHEAEMTGLQLQVAELEGRLKAQKEALNEAAEKNTQVNSSVETIEKLKEAVGCGVCMDTLKDPHICGHIACKECLQTYFRTNNALVHRMQDHGEDLPADVDISYRTKLCHVCRSHILRRPTRMYHLSIFFELLGLEAHFPSASQMQAEQAAVQAQTKSSSASGSSASRGSGEGINSAVVDKKDDPWCRTFPVDATSYTLYDESDQVDRCPECHAEVDGGRCMGCDIEFSDDGEDDWEGMGSQGEDSEGSVGSGDSRDDDEGGADGRRRSGRRVAIAGDDSEDEVERETTPNAQPVNTEMAVQLRMRQVAEQRARHDRRPFNVIFTSPTTQRRARELVEAETPGGMITVDDSSDSGAGTQTSDEDVAPRPARRPGSTSRNGSRIDSRQGSASRSSSRNRGSRRRRERRIDSFIDDEASSDDDMEGAEEEDEDTGFGRRSRGTRNGGVAHEEMDDADRLANMDFNATRDRASARRVGRSEHVGDEADSQVDEDEEGENKYDLEDGFIDDGEVEEGSLSESEGSDSDSDGYEARRRTEKKLRAKIKKLRARARNDNDDRDDNESFTPSDRNGNDNEDEYDSDAPQEVDHEAMRLARTKRFGVSSVEGENADGSLKQGQGRKGTGGRYEVGSSLEVEEPVESASSRRVRRTVSTQNLPDSDSDEPVLQTQSRSSSQRSRRKNRVVDPDSDVEMA